MREIANTIVVPIVVRGWFRAKRIGTIYYRVFQCDECKRVDVTANESTDAPPPYCCAPCRACGKPRHDVAHSICYGLSHEYRPERRRESRT